ncbi:MAG TPA: response regulator transcription factor [Solirubrobacteraceae bacterium]|nr:response regulator transcription factor [Solirubrobacteraceae bacterium]
MRRVRLLVAEDAPTRFGIRIALNGEAEICAEVEDPTQAIRAAKREQPEICLIGRRLCGDGMATIRAICRAAPNAAVVVLAETTDDEDLIDAVRAGAIGYAPGGIDAGRLRRIIRAVACNEAVVPRSMVLDLVMELRVAGSGADALTSREAQVLGMLRRGHTTSAIADRLGIAPVTVRRHISELVHKLGVEDRSELLNHGWWGQIREARARALHSV